MVPYTGGTPQIINDMMGNHIPANATICSGSRAGASPDGAKDKPQRFVCERVSIVRGHLWAGKFSLPLDTWAVVKPN
jgi:hypothetical protein